MRRRALIVTGLVFLLAACGGGTAPTATSGGASTAPASAASSAASARPGGAQAATPVAGGTPSAGRAPATSATPAGATRTVNSATPGAPLPSAQPVVFAPAPWEPGEKTRYTVTARDTGQPAGDATYALGREFESETLSATVNVNQTQDRFQLGFDTKSFTPVSELRSIVTPQGTIDIQAEFHQGGATVQVINREGTNHRQLVLPARYYANDQFVVILRALPFATGYQGALTFVPSQGDPPTQASVVTVTGQEEVATSFGALRCWRVEAQFEGTGAIQVLWYAVEKPHYLVKYDTGRYVYLLAGQP